MEQNYLGQKMTTAEHTNALNQKLSINSSLDDVFDLLLKTTRKDICFSTSLGLEDQVLTDYIFRNQHPVRVFTLDTGRLFQQTYDVLSSTQKKYKIPIQVFTPKSEAVAELISCKGANSFYDSIENRKECCEIRKIEPLKRALKGSKIWITGLRKEQSDNRSSLNFFEYEPGHNIIKLNPLLNWSLDQVHHYLDFHKVPQNKLHQQGYISIGCAPCTRAILEHEDLRAGRWWWESSHKECGLHNIK